MKNIDKKLEKLEIDTVEGNKFAHYPDRHVLYLF
jgi:hypothetical protein